MTTQPEDPRTRADRICGVIHIGATGIEWICIRPVHATMYQRRASDPTHRRGDPIINDSGQAIRHYMVPRYPNRGAHSGWRDPHACAKTGTERSVLPTETR